MQKYEEVHFVDTAQTVWNYSLFTDEDVCNFQNGTHYSLYNLFGNKQVEVLGQHGTYFAVWAPNATAVFVIGNFNNWDNETHPLKVRLDSSGIWEGFIPNINKGEVYKYHLHGYKGVKLDKGDPYANYWELRPLTASITWDTKYAWKDTKWLKQRVIKNRTDQPYSVYEVHLASWMRPDKNNEDSYNSYTQLIDLLGPYVKELAIADVAGDAVTDFTLRGLQFKTLYEPCTDYLVCTYKAGYTAAAFETYPILPNDLLNCIKDQVSFLFENRGENGSHGYSEKVYRTVRKYTRNPLFI